MWGSWERRGTNLPLCVLQEDSAQILHWRLCEDHCPWTHVPLMFCSYYFSNHFYQGGGTLRIFQFPSHSLLKPSLFLSSPRRGSLFLVLTPTSTAPQWVPHTQKCSSLPVLLQYCPNTFTPASHQPYHTSPQWLAPGSLTHLRTALCFAPQASHLSGTSQPIPTLCQYLKRYTVPPPPA